jgi:5-methylcytosine-specific restriction enzyme subunit McrC
MAPPEPLTLTEYDECEVHHPPPSLRVRKALDRELGRRLQLTWLADDRLRIRTSSWVGVVRLPDATSVRVVPKLAGDELQVLYMLGLVGGLRPDELLTLERSIDTAVSRDLVDLLCALLISATSQLLASGAIRDYRQHQDDLPYVRGRVELVSQSTRHFGRVDVLACHFEAFDHDVLENRVLRVALARASDVGVDPTIKRRARQLHDELLDIAPGSCPSPADVERQLQYDRRNEGYRTAHVWALALLKNQSVVRPFDDVGQHSNVFLIDMNSLFERFVEWLFKRTLDPGQFDVQAQYRDRSLLWNGQKRWGTVVPDLLIRRGQATLAVDAKYKRYDLKRVSPDDLYQLFLYAQAYRGFGETPSSVLVFPSESRQATQRLDLRVGGATKTFVVAVALHLQKLLEELRSSPLGAEAVPASVRRDLEDAMACDQVLQRRDGLAPAAPALLPRPTPDRRTDRSSDPIHGGSAVPTDDESFLDPWAAVLGEEFASEPTNGIPVPPPTAPWWQLAEFALTFDGYKRFGGFDPLSDMANAAAKAWHNRRALPATLDEARGSLFFEQRRHRHMDSDPQGESLDYVRALVRRIHDLSGGAVERESPAL